MNWLKMPPLASLKAFEAAARNRSYSAAGREMNVSHAAVAQQVRALESYLGVRLAERAGRGIAVTAEGALLAESLSRGFGEIASAIRQLGTMAADRPIHVTMTPAFASSWFLPRMPSLNAAHPEITLNVNPTAALVDFASGDVDVAIRYGSGTWPGLESEPLMASDFVIVGTPELVEARWDGTLQGLGRLPWFQEYGTAEVAEWMAGQGLELPPQAQITSLPGHMVMSAVLSGQGIAVLARAFLEDDIAAGRLIALFTEEETLGGGYFLVTRPGPKRPTLETFIAWIRARRDWDPSSQQTVIG